MISYFNNILLSLITNKFIDIAVFSVVELSQTVTVMWEMLQCVSHPK